MSTALPHERHTAYMNGQCSYIKSATRKEKRTDRDATEYPTSRKLIQPEETLNFLLRFLAKNSPKNIQCRNEGQLRVFKEIDVWRVVLR